MCATLDTYGFALSGMTNDELRGRERCLQRSSSQLAAWKRVLAQRPVHLAGRRVKEMVRRGIPPELRPDVWFALSGAAAMRDSHPTQYYAQLRGCCEDVVEPLDSETYRMFVRILGPEGIATVQCIFAAYRLHRDVDGASLHLAAVVAFLLVVMGPEREEDVFWLFLSLIDNKIYNNKTSYKVHFTLFFCSHTSLCSSASGVVFRNTSWRHCSRKRMHFWQNTSKTLHHYRASAMDGSPLSSLWPSLQKHWHGSGIAFSVKERKFFTVLDL